MSSVPVRVAAALCLAAACGAAGAETPLSAAEFEAYTTGKTLTYTALGQPFGVEEYLENRRVRWSFLDGECQDGTWYPAGELICFAYEGIAEHQCWSFFRGASGLRALYRNDPAQTEVYETRASDEPMLCLGPKVGA